MAPWGRGINLADKPHGWGRIGYIRHYFWGLAGDVSRCLGWHLSRYFRLFPGNSGDNADFWTYFLLPIVFGVDIPEITTVVCALALIASAYLAHAVKAGIVAIGAGQWQAGLSLGFNRWQVLWFVVLPQALRMMVPSFINQWISLIKDTSLAYIVGVNELTFLATQVNNRSMVYPMEVFLFVALIYFVLCLALDLLANGLNRRFSPQHVIKKQNTIKRLLTGNSKVMPI